MKKKLLIVLILLAVIGGALWVWDNRQIKSAPAKSPDSSYTPDAKNPPVATNQVVIHDYEFTPADITVKKGTTVTWTNKDLVAYTVVEDDGQTGGPASSPIPKDQTYSFKFAKSGLFHYHNSLDPNMTGTVTVTE